MTRIFLHPYAGVLSAYGMGLADLRALREQAIEKRLAEDVMPELSETLARLEEEARGELDAQQIEEDMTTILRRVHLRYEGTDSALRYEGTDSALIIDFGTTSELSQRFAEAHRQRYGFVMPDKALVVEAVSLEAVGQMERIEDPWLEAGTRATAFVPLASVRMYASGRWHDTPAYARDDLQPGDLIDGPAIIIEPTSTTVLDPGWQARLSERDHLILQRVVPLEREVAVGTQVDPVMLEVFNNLFMSIAEQMGSTLENTAYSVNIKERLDFSCALFDPRGNLVANAPHMPVHLGSMSESIRTIIRERREAMSPGDVYMLNAPYNGGTHLPDITVITPVFNAAGREILFFVASRGHHADVGGTTPGSMPPDSTTVEEEGVLIDNFLLVEGGAFREAETGALFASGAYPARNVVQNIADLKAQIAANEKGVQELRRMIEHFGLDVVHAYMEHVQDNAEEQVRRVLEVLKDGAFTYALDPRAGAPASRWRSRSTGQTVRRASTFPRPRPSSRATSMRPRRSAGRQSSMSSGRWWPMRFR
jgi:5-oxoprolinase (ATP-hydrolysing)